MNKKLYPLATGAVIALLSVTPAFADSHGGSDNRGFFGGHLGVNASAHASNGIGSIVSSLAHAWNHSDNDGNTSGNDKSDHDRKDATTTSPSDKTFLKGTVTAVSGLTITLASDSGVYTVNTTSATRFDKDATIANIAVGDTVAVAGAKSGSTITATSVHDSSLLERWFASKFTNVRAGVVSAITSGGFLLNPFGSTSTSSVAINSATQIYAKGGATTSAAIADGSKVIAFGTTSATSTDSSFVASVILVLNHGFGFLKHFFFR
jgi:hypothetical protein